MDATDDPPANGLIEADLGFDGLLWAYRFSELGTAEILQGRYLREALENQENWLWLHFDLGDERTYRSISSLPHLPRSAMAKLLTTEDRQHIDSFGQVIGGVITDYENVDPLDAKRIVRWQFVLTPHLFVSARRLPAYTLNQVHLDLQSGRCYPDVLSLFTAIIHEFASATSVMLHELTGKLDEMEEQFLDQKMVSAPEVLGMVRRRLVRLHRQAVPLRAVLIHMLTERPDWFPDEAATDCQRVAERMDSLADDLESLRERGHTLHDEFNTREAEKTNKRLTVLSIVSALLLPPTLITGVFGMNVAGLPFRETPLGFVGTCALMAASVVGMLVILRRIKLL
jgi:zinc transporter